MKVARLSVLRAGPQKDISVLISVSPEGYSATKRIKSVKNAMTLSGMEPAIFRLAQPQLTAPQLYPDCPKQM